MEPCALPILEISTQQETPDSVISDTYKINIQNFVSVLEKVGDHPFAAYCMSGTSRIGKSYTLNFFMRKLGCEDDGQSRQFQDWFQGPIADMFSWRNGQKRETVGINLWSDPFFVTRHGKKVAILFMDGQGLFDNETTFQQNAVIFSLCSLLSSLCIFNVMKKIDAECLQHLQFFSDYSRAIGNKQKDDDSTSTTSTSTSTSGSGPSENGNGAGSATGEIQKLVILVRDFDDVEEYGYGYHDMDSAPLNQNEESTHKNYFKDTMLIDPEDSRIPSENQTTIKGIRDNYGNIGIYLLPDPGKKFRLKPLVAVPDEDYQQYLIELVDLMTSEKHLTTKKIDGEEITATAFIPFVKHLDFICQHAKDNFPSAKTIAESTKMMTNTLAVNNAYKVFKSKCNALKDMPSDATDQDFKTHYEKILEEAKAAFGRMKKVGGKVMENMCLEQLIDKCKGSFESMKQLHQLNCKLKAATEKCKKEQEQLYQQKIKMDAQIQELLKNKTGNKSQIEKLQQEMEMLKEREYERSLEIDRLDAQSKSAQQQHDNQESWGYLDIAKNIGSYVYSKFY